MTKEPPRSEPRVNLGWTLAGLVAGLVLLLILIRASGATLDGLVEALRTVPVWVWGIVVILHVVIIVIAALKWLMVLAETGQGDMLPLKAATAATATGALLGQIISIQVSVPIVRAWVARRYNVSASAAAGTSLFEQSLELLTLGVAAVASAMLLASGGQVWVAVVVLFALLAIGTQAIKPALMLGAWCLRALPFPGRLSNLAEMLAEAFDLARNQRARVLRQLMGLSLLRYGCITAQSVIILLAILPEVGPIPLIVAFPVILLVMSLPFLPAGLGVAEVTWASTLILQGIDPATAAEAAVTLRIVSLASFLAVYPFIALASRPERDHSA